MGLETKLSSSSLHTYALKYSFGTFETNLLTIPSTVLGLCTMFIITYISEQVNERSIVAAMEDLWGLPFLIILYLLPANPNQWVYYVKLYHCVISTCVVDLGCT